MYSKSWFPVRPSPMTDWENVKLKINMNMRLFTEDNLILAEHKLIKHFYQISLLINNLDSLNIHSAKPGRIFALIVLISGGDVFGFVTVIKTNSS